MSFSLRSDDVFDYIGYSEDIQIEFLCDVCKKPLLDAQMATPCGHTFCGKCVDQLKGTSRQVPCPLCRQIVQEFCRNIFVTQLLTRVQGDCLACKDKVQLDTAKQHIEKCQEIDVVCLQCNQTVKRRTQPAHESACPMREITCGCGEKCKHADLEKHRASYCSFQKSNCPLNCGHVIERYLLPSHTLQCPGVVQYCPIKGCGEIVRKGNIEQHMESNLSRHFSLLREERNNILWRGHEAAWFVIQHQRNGEVGTFKWSVHPNTSQVACSPLFEKWNRRWRLFCTKKGHNLEYGLEYVQGVSPIHVALSFIMECHDSSYHVQNIPVVNIKEGETARDVRRTGIPRSIIVRMDQLEPVYS